MAVVEGRTAYRYARRWKRAAKPSFCPDNVRVERRYLKTLDVNGLIPLAGSDEDSRVLRAYIKGDRST